MLKKTILTVFVATALAGCATINPYHPAKSASDTGFSEQQLDDNRYRVTFRGDSTTSREDVEDYLLYRAAELTVEKGHDYFIMAEQDTEAKTSLRTVRRAPFYGRYAHPFYDPYYSFPYYAYGFDWGYPHDADIYQTTRYSAEAYIALYSGKKPEDNPRAFNARSVMQNIGPVDCYKKEKHDEGECALSHSHS